MCAVVMDCMIILFLERVNCNKIPCIFNEKVDDSVYCIFLHVQKRTFTFHSHLEFYVSGLQHYICHGIPCRTMR